MPERPSMEALFEAAQNGDSLDSFMAGNESEEKISAEPAAETPEAPEDNPDQEVSEDEESEDQELEDEDSEEEDSTPDEEFIEADGKRVKVDYKDRAKIKQAYASLIGMRKAFAERDKLAKFNQELSQRLTEQEALWSKIEEASSSEDYDMLAKIMSKGKFESAETLFNERVSWKKRYEAADETTRKLMDKEVEAKQLRRELDQERQNKEKLTEKAQEQRAAAEQAESRTALQSIFNEYSFSGKLGDPAAERKLNKMLWNQVVNSSLQEYEGEDIPDDVARQEFQDYAEVLSKVVESQVKTHTQKSAKARKRKAKTEAQKIVKAGGDKDSLRSEFDQAVRRGKLADVLHDDRFKTFLKNWN